MRFAPARIWASAILAAGAVFITISCGSAQERPRLRTNEQYVEDVSRATALAVDDPMAVFAFVFETLPQRVNVYPTENYYYFTFIHQGAPYAGNIRIEPH